MSNFVHLHVHSHYSPLDGLAKPHELINKAKEYQMPAIALTDHGNLYGAIEFYKNAKVEGIKPILGVEGYFAPGGRKNKGRNIDKQRYHITLLAKNEQGWKNLIKLVTASHLEGFYYKPRIDKELLEKYHEGIICLSGCMSGEISRLIAEGKMEDAEKTARWYKIIFGDDYYLEIQAHAPHLHQPIVNLARKLDIPLVATQDTHYVNKEDRTAHEILLAVQTRNPFDDSDRLSLKEFDLSLKSPEEIAEIFKDIPEAIENTLKIADKCNVEIKLREICFPKFPLPPGETPDSYLQKLVEKRLTKRFQKITSEIRKRINHELSVIKETGFANYFLIVQDIVNWAKDHGIVVGPGRGSAAGSLVSYVLGITNVDPLKYDLLFERFLNPDRIQVPDIDIDFADTRRDEVLAYVRDRYGEDKVAQIITFGTMMARAAIRDTGRALGLPYSFCDRIAKMIPFNSSIDQALESVTELKEEYNSNPDVKNLIDSAKKLEGTVRHASVHACGVVISADPLTNHLPLQRAPQGEDTIITQFEFHNVEDLGLLKMDFLGLKNLTTIEGTLRLIKENHGIDIDINNIPLDDPKTFKLLQNAETIGVFQLESSGMRRYLKELRPSELEDIIAMIALYRPGPMDLIPHYIKRKFGEEKIEYLHPKLEPILSSTYGVGIYQEQMMRIARDLAGFTLAEADTLRKAIGKKIGSLLNKQKEKLINGMIKNGIDKKTAERIWDLFPPFARYGFNRSHSASYAMISYQTAYLKANYPLEFMTSLLNTSAGDIDRINMLINECKRLGIEVLPPDINLSEKTFAIDGENKAIRFGFLGIKNIGYNIVDAIIEERIKGGPFADLVDFLLRIRHRDLNKKSLESLIKCGAFDSLGIERGQALENLEDIIKFNQTSKKQAESNQGFLFGKSHFATLRLKPATQKIDRRQILLWEKELLGLYLTEHPFESIAKKLPSQVKPIEEVVQQGENDQYPSNINVAGIVTAVKHIITKRGDSMLFVTLEDQTDKMEVLVFSNTLAKTKEVWKDGKAVIVNGRLSFRDNEAKLIADNAKIIQ